MADGAEGCPLRRYSAVDSSENIVNRNKTYPGDSQSPHLHDVVPAQTEGIPPFLSRRSWEAGVPYHGEVVSRDVSQSRSVGPKSQPSTEATRSTTTMRSCALNASESFDVENVLPPVRKRAVSLRNPRRAGDQDFGKPGSDVSASPAAATWSVAAPASHCSNRGTRMGRSSSYSELLPVGNAACGCGRMRVSSLRDLLQHYGSPDVGKDAGDATLPEVWGGASKYIPKLPRQPACSVFALFSMMERDRFESFAALFKRHRQLLEPFVEHVVDQWPPLFPDVVNIVEFLRNPSDAPGEYFFDYSLVAWPFSVLYAASCFYVTAKQHGYRNLFDVLRLRGGLLTCGKDVLAALAIAMSPTEEDLLRNVSNMYHAAFFVGSVYIDDERCLETHVRKCSNCSFALLLVNITIPCLQLLVERINQLQIFSRARYDRTEGPTACVIPLSKVEITRVISTRCAIVCGNPVDLERLDILVLRYACAAGIKVHKEFLPIFTPENSLFYNQSKHLQLLQLWSDNGVELDASSMHLTVYSPVDGKPWSSGSIGSLLDEVARAVTCSSHDLTHSLQQLQNGDVLLDFSATEPGIGKLVEWEQRDVVVLSEPADVVALNILSTPRRGRAKHVMESTLNKCAVINDILKVISWECEPRLAYTETLSCTFVDFGLVMKRPETGREINECYQRLCEVSHPVTGTCTSCGVPSVKCLWEDVMATQEQSCGLPEYIVVANGQPPGAVGVHQVSPTVKYYEVQSGCVLLLTGVEFTRRLSHYTRLPFPPHTLLMCPTVLDLIHLWETYEFLGGRAPTNLA